MTCLLQLNFPPPTKTPVCRENKGEVEGTPGSGFKAFLRLKLEERLAKDQFLR